MKDENEEIKTVLAVDGPYLVLGAVVWGRQCRELKCAAQILAILCCDSLHLMSVLTFVRYT